ncbi:MAG: hemolysin family protein [Candidatus Hydrogenedentota bacterium]
MVVFIASVAVALGISCLCSLMEAALLSLSPSQVADINEKSPAKGRIWQGFKRRIDRPISVILVLNTAAHTIGASVAGASFDQLYGQQHVWLFSLLFTFAMLQFTEITPKTLGVRFNRELAVLIARPLYLGVLVFGPLLAVLRWFNKPFDRRSAESDTTPTTEEITSLAKLALFSREITPQQAQIIGVATHLNDITAKDIMVPVDQISFLATDMKLGDALVAAHADAHTRYPVCEGGNKDTVVGYVNFKEIAFALRTNPHDPSLRGIVRPIRFVHEDEVVSRMLRRFVSEHVHMAIVQDDKGCTLGMLTLEDMLEEMVGEIEDEFDRLPRMTHVLGDGSTLMVGGGAPIRQVADRLGFDVENPAMSVSRWITDRLGRPPMRGEEIAVGPCTCTVRRVRRNHVFEAVFMKHRENET